MEQNRLLCEKYKELNTRIQKLFGLNLNITFVLDLKGFRLIGQCKKNSKNDYIIRLHARLINEFKEVYIEDVLTHELAHAIQMELYPKSKPHGIEWKNIVETLSGNKYHARNKKDYGLKKPTKTTYLYKCSCMKHAVSPLIHKRAQKKKYIYSCKKCKTRLELV